MTPIDPEQLAAIQRAEHRALGELDARLAAIPFGSPEAAALSAPVDRELINAIVHAIRKAGAVDAHTLVRVLTSLAGEAAAAYFKPAG